ncbi:TPA: hypothetical protein ACGOYQ_002101, partial [Streptococcus suis]
LCWSLTLIKSSQQGLILIFEEYKQKMITQQNFSSELALQSANCIQKGTGTQAPASFRRNFLLFSQSCKSWKHFSPC